MLEMIGKVLPIIFLFILGVWFKYSGFILDQSMKDIKKIVLNVALPCVLCNTFLNMEVKPEHGILVILTLILLALFMICSKLLNSIPIFHYKYNVYVSTGYGFGLMGMTLFIMMFGAENLEMFSVMGLAHEFFIWVIYYILFRVEMKQEKIDIYMFINVFKSPIILGILVGLLANFTGISTYLNLNPIGQGILSTMDYLSNISAPFILISLGYGTNINKKYLKESFKLIIVRALTIITVGIGVKVLLIDNLMPQSLLLDVSYIAFIAMPPMLILPLLISQIEGEKEHEEIVSSTMGICSIFNIIIFVLIAFAMPL
ncbi:hypothetical protein AN640_03155 [Candidatus Epulonipiscium fishelsonii]|uniref:Uncharacterized protein n=1 Tax=Candidatus Epulonipiscium fishelsonii TaxID=77094 RepID=A0ACC8XJS3_9FIRM|nr:hypothetical protein AN640_03155 [Epulopiscium sp. SCG-D08WGA-EpuloA1]